MGLGQTGFALFTLALIVIYFILMIQMTSKLMDRWKNQK